MRYKDISRFSIHLFLGILIFALSVPVWAYSRIFGLFYFSFEKVPQWIQTLSIFIVVCLIALLIARLLERIAVVYISTSPFGRDSSSGERILRLLINLILIIVSSGVFVVIAAYYVLYLSSGTVIPFDPAAMSPPAASLIYWLMPRGNTPAEIGEAE